MFLSGLPKTSAEQLSALLGDVDCRRIYVPCSGLFRLERTILAVAPGAAILGNDVSLFSCAIGEWLAGGGLPYRFKGPLEPLEHCLAAFDGTDRQGLGRAGGAALALELAQYGRGKPNLYKDAHWRHLTADLPEQLALAMAKIGSAFGDKRLAGFKAGSWLRHIDEAIAERATIVGHLAPETSMGAGLKAWVEANADWDRPAGGGFEPAALQKAADQIIGSGVGYVLVTADRLERHEPKALFTTASRVQHRAYAAAGHARYARASAEGKPFNYLPLDLAKLSADSQVEVVRTDGPRAMYIRSIYLKKTIAPVAGVHNYLIYLGGMLAGVIVYSPAKFAPRPNSIYLLSDVSVSREAKVSKLIARLATNGAILGDMAARTLAHVDYVVTTAFSDHPVSMKYRGLFELLSRKDPPDGQPGHVLQYGSEVRRETPQEAFSWWWTTYVEEQAGAGGRGGRGSQGRGGRGRR